MGPSDLSRGQKDVRRVRQDDGRPTLGLKVGFDRQEELLKDDRFYPTPYAARQGWVSIRIDGKTDWEEIGGLIREAYRQVAISRMLKTLDEEDK